MELTEKQKLARDLERAVLNEDGGEVLDPTPVVINLGDQGSDRLMDRIKDIIRQEFGRVAQDKGLESFEEATDFGDEYEDIDDAPESVYQVEMRNETLNPIEPEGKKPEGTEGAAPDLAGDEPVEQDSNDS